MKVALLETCRSPEIEKITEVRVLVRFFTEQGIPFALYSNDHIWPQRTVLDTTLLQQYIGQSDTDTVHVAMHGDAASLVLQWSQEPAIGQRRPLMCLQASDIVAMPEWRGKRVVSGACHSAPLAAAFLAAGAACVIAPESPIPWSNLGVFFATFYHILASGGTEVAALETARAQFPEFSSYRLFRR
jgi:hypothetical protein